MSAGKVLSVVIPAYNEERSIGQLLENVMGVDLSRFDVTKQVIVVDDGSTDATTEIVDRLPDGVNFLEDLPGRAPDRFVPVLVQQPGISQDRPQGVPELVSDPGGQAAYRHHILPQPGLVLQVADFGQVGHQDQGPRIALPTSRTRSHRNTQMPAAPVPELNLQDLTGGALTLPD